MKENKRRIVGKSEDVVRTFESGLANVEDPTANRRLVLMSTVYSIMPYVVPIWKSSLIDLLVEDHARRVKI